MTTGGVRYELPATDPRNPLVPLRHERFCHKSNWRKRHGIPDSPEATLRLWPCTPTLRSDTSPLHAMSGRGHSSRLQTRQQTGVETPTRTTLPSVDAVDWRRQWA